MESISIPTIAPIPLENEIQSDEHDDSQLQLSENKLRYQLLEAGPGATVLSISEKLHNGSLPVSIEQLIADFKQLNDGTAPEKIQIGKVYKFPIYLPE